MNDNTFRIHKMLYRQFIEFSSYLISIGKIKKNIIPLAALNNFKEGAQTSNLKNISRF